MILKVNETAHRDFTSGIILLNPAIFQAESYKGRIKSNFMNQRFRYRKYLTYALASGSLSHTGRLCRPDSRGDGGNSGSGPGTGGSP